MAAAIAFDEFDFTPRACRPRLRPIRDGEDVSVDNSATPDRSTDKALELGVKKRIAASPPKNEFTFIALQHYSRVRALRHASDLTRHHHTTQFAFFGLCHKRSLPEVYHRPPRQR